MSTHRLTRRLTLEEPEMVADGAGGFTRIWRPLGQLWAEVRARSGRETAAGGLTTAAEVSYKITVRAAPVGSPERPRPEQRFREGSRVFQIIAVAESDAGQRYLTCFANEETAA